MRRRIAIAFTIAALLLSVPSVAFAAKQPKNPNGTYALDWTLPTAGKSGCMVCHGDPNLAQIQGEDTVTVFVSVEQLDSSAHAADLCTGCHIDFAYTAPHDNAADEDRWKIIAKSACAGCKDHTTQSDEYLVGSHSPAGRPGEEPSVTAAAREAEGKPVEVPLCGDCHDSHSIPSKEDTAAQQAYHLTGNEVCGDCHDEESESYADYYHGAAYRAGAPDAPACWDCHGTHKILPADDRNSMVNERNLVETCGQEQCHTNVDEKFIESAEFVHGRIDVVTNNPVNAFLESARSTVSGVFESVFSIFGKG